MHPDKELFFVAGTDLLEGLEKWDCGKQLIEEVNFLIILRTGCELNPKFLPKNYLILESTFVGSSSSEARKRIERYFKRIHLNDLSQDIYIHEKDKEKQLVSNPKWNIKTQGEKLDNYHDNYLGLYGILSFGVIQYIKEKKFYFPKDEK